MAECPQQPSEKHCEDIFKVSSDSGHRAMCGSTKLPTVCLGSSPALGCPPSGFCACWSLPHLAGATAAVLGVPRQDLLVAIHTLGEGLATAVGAQIS